MNIGIIGSGHIGGTAARLFAGAGHQVAISHSRGPESLADLVRQIGPSARAVTVEEAEQFGDVVLVAIPFGKYETIPAAPVAGKIVVDAMNYYAGRDGEMQFGGLTSSELVAKRLPRARVVKAFNTMYFETLATAGKPNAPEDERLVLFVAGDDAGAKATVSDLIREIGFTPIDTGSLHESSRQEPGAPIYNHPMNAREAREALAAGS